MIPASFAVGQRVALGQVAQPPRRLGRHQDGAAGDRPRAASAACARRRPSGRAPEDSSTCESCVTHEGLYAGAGARDGRRAVTGITMLLPSRKTVNQDRPRPAPSARPPAGRRRLELAPSGPSIAMITSPPRVSRSLSKAPCARRAARPAERGRAALATESTSAPCWAGKPNAFAIAGVRSSVCEPEIGVRDVARGEELHQRALRRVDRDGEAHSLEARLEARADLGVDPDHPAVRVQAAGRRSCPR